VYVVCRERGTEKSVRLPAKQAAQAALYSREKLGELGRYQVCIAGYRKACMELEETSSYC